MAERLKKHNSTRTNAKCMGAILTLTLTLILKDKMKMDIKVTDSARKCAENYLECFVSGPDGFDIDRMLNRATLHNELITECLASDAVLYCGPELYEIKRRVSHLTDNLDREINLPINGIFIPAEYSYSLTLKLMEAIRKAIRSMYTEYRLENIANMYHGLCNTRIDPRRIKNSEALYSELTQIALRLAQDMPRGYAYYYDSDASDICIKYLISGWFNLVLSRLAKTQDKDSIASICELVHKFDNDMSTVMRKILKGRITPTLLCAACELAPGYGEEILEYDSISTERFSIVNICEALADGYKCCSEVSRDIINTLKNY